MKKIRCDMREDDFLRVIFDDDLAVIHARDGGETTEIALSPDKIRKLRKQLKRALIEIEGEDKKADESEFHARERNCREDEKAEKYKPGDQVYLIHGHNEGHVYEETPSVVNIDLRIPVTLVRQSMIGDWILEYTMIDGQKTTGCAYEKSFGPRA